MISRLNQLSLAQFIELLCGDNSVLFEREEKNDDDLKKKASEIIMDYRTIVDEAGTRSIVMDREEAVKNTSKVLFLQICKSLLDIGINDKIRSLLDILDINTNNIDDEHLAGKIEDLFLYAVFEKKRNDESRDSEMIHKSLDCNQIRSSFDAEIAFIMTYFKMNIDARTINAATYANIVRQAFREINSRRNTFFKG